MSSSFSPMATFSQQGKFFIFLCLLFILASPVRPFVNSTLDLVPTHREQEHNQHHPNHQANPQEILLKKLEELVRNLSDLVEKLELKLSEIPPKFVTLDRNENQERGRSVRGKKMEETRDGDRVETVSFTKFSPSWSERLQFVSTVKLDSDATCIDVLPLRDYEGFSKYVAVGDDRGRVYVLSRNGDVLVEYHTKLDSSITAMTSYLSVNKNESFVITGHQNGDVLIHKVYESSNGEEKASIFVENVGKCEDESEGFAISILEMYHVGRLRYILSSDVSGRIRVFRQDGTIHGSAMPDSKPLAFLKQKLLFLTDSGAGSLDLRTMTIRESQCEGSNGSLVRSYAFDATERSKAYGFTSEGDLIHILLLGDVMNFKCRIRSRKKVEFDWPIAIQPIKGYLLIVNLEKVFVYNVSSPRYVRVGVPRLLFSAVLDEIRSSFLDYQSTEDDFDRNNAIPLVGSDHEKLIVFGLRNGYLGIYISNLPILNGDFNTMLWAQPVVFFLILLFGAWQFFAKKKEALTSWGPDDPFGSRPPATTGALMGSDSGDRSIVSRNADVTNSRAGGLRDRSRGRYISPSRYPGGATISFRPSSADVNTVDPNYRRPTSELFRGPTMESTGFPKRRESVLANSQIDEANQDQFHHFQALESEEHLSSPMFHCTS